MQATSCRALAKKIQCRFGLSPAQLDEITGIILNYCWCWEDEADEIFGYPEGKERQEIFEMIERCTGHRPISSDHAPWAYECISQEESQRRFEERDSKNGKQIPAEQWYYVDHETGKYIAVDNRTYDFRMNEFDNLKDCEDWLMGLNM